MVSFTSSTLLLAAIAILFGNVAQAADLTAPNWVIPANRSPYPSMSATVGDSLTFGWEFGTHDVWIYPSGTCDNTNAILVGNVNQNPSKYIFTADQAGTTVTFACDIGQHCQLGMIMDVTVRAAPVPSPTEAPVVPVTEPPTDAPVVAPTDVPVATPTDAPVASPTDVPVATPTDSPVAEPIELPPVDGPYGRCFVCGSEDAQVTLPEVIITLPSPNGPPFDVDCATLFKDGLTGQIPEGSCPFITNRAAPCACAVPTEETDTETDTDTDTDTPAPNVTATDAPTPAPFESCSICGDDFKVINAGAEITVDGLGTLLCGDLEATGLAGGLSPEQCIASGEANLEGNNPCFCRRKDGFPVCDICPEGEIPFAVNSEVTLSPFEIYSCGVLAAAGLNGELPPAVCPLAQERSADICSCAPADYTCNICGGDGTNVTMLYPEVNISIPEELGLGIGDSVNCGFLETAGIDGILGPNECAAASPLVQSLCGCAPVGYTCNICGQDSGMTISEPDVAFIPGDDTTCSQAQNAGLSGETDPTRCEALTPLAQSFCGCVEGGTLVPVVEDETEPPVVEDVTEPPAVDTMNTTEAPVAVDPEDDSTESGTATGVEGDANASKSGSAAVSFLAAIAVSSLVGLVVSLIV